MTAAAGRTLRGSRVVLVNWRDPWHRLAGGSEQYAWEFAVALRDAGASVEFWTARDLGQLRGSDHTGIHVRRRGGPYGFYARSLVALLWDRLRRRAPDIVVDMDCGIPAFTPLVLSRRTPVVLVVHHIHQEQFRTAMRRPVSDLGRFLEGRLMPAVYRDVPTVAVSDSTVTEMRKQLGWRGEVRVIHNGTDLPPVTETVGSNEERVVVLGRLVAHKRVHLVVRAVAEVRRGRPGLTLDVVGTGDELERVRGAVHETGLDGVVTVHGFLDDTDKSRVLSRAVLHVCASDAEGWGQVVLEAAAHGVPTLARDVPGLRDSIRDGQTGWLVAEPSSSTDDELVARLAAGIESSLHTLSDPATRSRTVASCREWAAGFGWERMHAEARDVVESALAQRR